MNLQNKLKTVLDFTFTFPRTHHRFVFQSRSALTDLNFCFLFCF